MKRRIVSITACILAALMLYTPTASAKLTDVQAAKRGVDVFEAWHMINYSSYEYMVTEYESPSHMFTEGLKSQPGWNLSLAAWRLATFDVKSEVSYSITKEVAYYKTFLRVGGKSGQG